MQRWNYDETQSWQIYLSILIGYNCDRCNVRSFWLGTTDVTFGVSNVTKGSDVSLGDSDGTILIGVTFEDFY